MFAVDIKLGKQNRFSAKTFLGRYVFPPDFSFRTAEDQRNDVQGNRVRLRGRNSSHYITIGQRHR